LDELERNNNILPKLGRTHGDFRSIRDALKALEAGQAEQASKHKEVRMKNR
jgi:hypothetical protein